MVPVDKRGCFDTSSVFGHTSVPFFNKMQPASGIGMSVPRAMKQCFPFDIEDPSRSCLSFLAYSIYQSGMDFASYLGAWDFVLTVMFQNQYS